MQTIVLAAVFLAVVLLVLGGYVLFNRDRLAEVEAARDRLRTLRGGSPSHARILRDSRRSSMPMFDAILRNQPLVARLENELMRSGLKWSVGEFVLGTAVCVVLGVLVGQHWGLVVGAIAVVLGLTAPFYYVERRRAGRAAKIEEQLPEALDMIVNGLRAGFSLPAAMQFVGEELAQPLGGEFHRFAEEQRLGVELRDALTDLEVRIGSLDAKLFVTALLVQSETGGALSEILLGLAAVIRDRAALRERVESLTAEPRASAQILGVLPAVSFGLLFLLNREFMQPMVATSEGNLLLGYAAASALVGYALLAKLAKVDL